MLAFGLTDDLYNEEKDNIDLMICDYFATSSEEEPVTDLFIEGRDTIRVGTGRTYKVNALDGLLPEWKVQPALDGVNIVGNGDYGVTLSVAMDDSLIGKVLLLECFDKSETYGAVTKEVEVISIG